MPNTKRLRRVMRAIRLKTVTHDQQGYKHCFLGAAVEIYGTAPEKAEYNHRIANNIRLCDSPRFIAQRILDINDDEAKDLMDSRATVAELTASVERITTKGKQS